MNLDQTTVPLEPRRASGCFDVAVRFFGRHLPDLLILWLHVALPACVLLYILTVRSEMDVRLSLIVVYIATWPLGVLVIAGTSRAVFGEPFAPKPLTRGPISFLRLLLIALDVGAAIVGVVVFADISADMLGTDFVYGSVELMWYVLLLVLLTARFLLFTAMRSREYPGFWRALSANGIRRAVLCIGPLLLLFPINGWFIFLGVLLSLFSIFVAIRKSFVVESIFLARLDEQLHGRGVRELIRREDGSLFFRGWFLSFLTVVLAMIVFATFDFACDKLLGYPILMGRLDQIIPSGGTDANPFNGFGAIIGEAFTLLLRDSRCLTVFTGTVLLVYPIARIAWFFCYIDLRVRRDCWDMDLKFQQEVRRLEGMA